MSRITASAALVLCASLCLNGCGSSSDSSQTSPQPLGTVMQAQGNLLQISLELNQSSPSQQRTLLAKTACSLEQGLRQRSITASYYQTYYGGLAHDFNRLFNSPDPSSGNSTLLVHEERLHCPNEPAVKGAG